MLKELQGNSKCEKSVNRRQMKTSLEVFRNRCKGKRRKRANLEDRDNQMQKQSRSKKKNNA